VRSASSFRRSAGLVAATTVAFSTTVLLGPATAQAADPWTAAGSGAQTEIPTGICAVEWTAVGGGAGKHSNGTPGGAAGKIIAVVPADAGDIYTLYPGGAGTDAVGTTPGTGGTTDDPDVYSPGQDGASDGAVAGGGGGAASTVVQGGNIIVNAHGADAHDAENLGGYGGGDGVNWAAGQYEESLDTNGGAGSISGVGIECMPATPYLRYAEPLDAGMRLEFAEGTDGDVPTTGYEYTKDGGTTWLPLTGITVEDGLQFATVTGLTNGMTYTVSVRAVGGPDTAPSAPSLEQDVTPRKKATAPTNVTVTTGPGTVTVSWSPSVAGTYPIIGYGVDLTWISPDGQSGGGGPICMTGPTVYTCTADVQPGVKHDLVVFARDSSGYEFGEPAFITTGLVPAALTVPEADGALELPSGGTATVAPGKTITVTGSGFGAFSTVTMLIYSEPQVLTTVVTDGTGSFSVEVTVPAGLAVGQHTLVAAGVDAAGQLRYLTLPITVTAGGAMLAATGADVTAPAIGGLAAVLLGAGLLVVARRRPEPVPATPGVDLTV
jgi:hypothetical protein